MHCIKECLSACEHMNEVTEDRVLENIIFTLEPAIKAMRMLGTTISSDVLRMALDLYDAVRVMQVYENGMIDIPLSGATTPRGLNTPFGSCPRFC